jgi:hypothetical protein
MRLGLLACGVAFAAAGVATEPLLPPVAPGPVSVHFRDPQHFSENRQFGSEDRFNNKSHYLEVLKAHLVKRAARMLPAGDHLDVTITDVKLAGAYEPWHGPQLRDVRIMKDIYPPRIDLNFKLTDGKGKVLREGSRKLRNLSYLTSTPGMTGDDDSLRYDKALLDSWLRRGPQQL